MDIKNLMNKEQYEAVCHKDGPLLILAGAGSGKTRVITYRIAHLISKYGVKPENILAVTFTNKAAAEMKSRIRGVIGRVADKLTMSTFHSLGCRIMRANAERLGYTKDFSIYAEDDRERLLKECMHQAKVSEKEMKPYDIIRRFGDIKNRLLTPEQYEAQASSYEERVTASIYTIYEARLKKNNAVDFDDLISKPIELLRNNPDILDAYREKFKYILIDEYQDINHSQYVLISMLAEKYKNLCVVGDDDQSIYRIRGADITNILNFEQDYRNARVIRLEQNYRSTKTVLKAAHAVIKNNEGRKGKELWTENPEGEKITFYYVDDAVMESECVINQVFKLLQTTDYKLKDMAVFYRTNAQSRVVEDRFRRAGVRYKLVGGVSFYSRLEIKDILAYLRVVANPQDVMSFKRIINVPPRGIGDTTVDKLEEYAFKNSLNFIESLDKSEAMDNLKPQVKSTLKAMHDFITGLHAQKDTMPLKKIVEKLLAGTGYLEYWENDPSPQAKDRVDNVKEFVSAIAEFEEQNKEAKLSDYLNQVALMTTTDELDESQDAVTLMTIHAAKGLEFDVVFITGMDEGVFPHKNCVEEPGGIEEERRLAYVGITRARKKLYLFSAVSRMQYGTRKIGAISRFVNEIPGELIEYKGRLPLNKVQDKYINYTTKTQQQASPSSVEYADEAPAEATDYSGEEQPAGFTQGQKVKHKIMGRGKVLNTEAYGDDVRVTVVFEKHGKKVLSAKHAGLEKI
ncbi:MAG: UvrD-helicase domain-containing protein [Spirochaetia bacterium]|nr:UvrD-helicase domain-containing protein [Spirochaetia bacterium]